MYLFVSVCSCGIFCFWPWAFTQQALLSDQKSSKSEVKRKVREEGDGDGRVWPGQIIFQLQTYKFDAWSESVTFFSVLNVCKLSTYSDSHPGNNLQLQTAKFSSLTFKCLSLPTGGPNGVERNGS